MCSSGGARTDTALRTRVRSFVPESGAHRGSLSLRFLLVLCMHCLRTSGNSRFFDCSLYYKMLESWGREGRTTGVEDRSAPSVQRAWKKVCFVARSAAGGRLVRTLRASGVRESRCRACTCARASSSAERQHSPIQHSCCDLGITRMSGCPVPCHPDSRERRCVEGLPD